MKTIGSIALLALLGACNTVEGFGRDLAEGGEVIEETAREARPPSRPVYRPAPAPAPQYQEPVQNAPYYY